jgi:6-phosphofructokinase
MSVVGVLSNVHSRRNSRSMGDVHAVVSAFTGVRHVAIHRFSAMPDGLAALARQGVDHLVISGGDGTVHAVVTELINRSPFARLPRLSILAGGTTNVIARDVASLQPPAWALKRLLEQSANGDPGEIVERRTIGLKRGCDNAAIYGFVTGALGFYRGTVLMRRRGNVASASRRFFGGLSVFWTLGRVARHGFGQKSGFVSERVRVGFDDQPEQDEELYLFLATTLETLVPGLMPFWGEGEGDMRITTIGVPGARFLEAVWSIARGQPKPWMPGAGYRSVRAQRARVSLSSPFVMDGEVFEPGPDGLIELSSGPSVAFTRY